TLFVGSVHVEFVPQPEVTAVIVDAFAAKACPAPSENCVEVTVRFHPPPVLRPRASMTLTGIVYVAVWSVPFSVRLNDGVPLAATERVVPAVTVPFTVTFAACAEAARVRAAAQTVVISLQDNIALVSTMSEVFGRSAPARALRSFPGATRDPSVCAGCRRSGGGSV